MKITFETSALRAALFALAVPSFLVHAAQPAGEVVSFPSRPIRIVIGFSPGGQPDITARLIGAKLTEVFKQQVVVDNRPGGSGVVGTKIVADATPDGHTLLAVSAAHVISPAIRAKLPYDTLKDFAGITMTASASYLLVVSPAFPARTLQEFIALAKAKPGQFAFSSAGPGSGTHFAAELLMQKAGFEALHVAYKGVPEAITDTMTGRVQFFLAPIASASPLVRDGKLRGLAVTSIKRAAILPDVPTLDESGLQGFRWDSWAGILAPVKTPRALIDKLNREIVRTLELPDIRERFRALGTEPTSMSPASFDKFLHEQYAIVVDIAKKAGIKAQ